MSELINNSEKIGKYDFRNIGSTSLLQLKKAGIIHGKDYIYILLKNVEGYLFDCYSNLSHFKIPVTTSTGSIVFYTNNTDYNSMLYQKDNQMTLTNLSVELKSSWGGTLDNSNKEWSFMLSFIKY